MYSVWPQKFDLEGGVLGGWVEGIQCWVRYEAGYARGVPRLVRRMANT